ncbi:MAG: hypothetical protein DRI90_10190 [Deltaproteobacteria bacterium]|nr:MAG: hypothetical protein DRI90_10190 [Deltaproteobacteria bacterium]
MAVWRAAAGVQWRGDLPAVRDQGLAALGAGGALSTVLAQALSLLPLGNLAFRAALGSTLALGLSCYLVLRIARRILRLTSCPPMLVSLLSMVAAVTAGLCPTWQSEATVGGGAMPAVAVVLLGVDLVMEISRRDAPTLTPAATRRWLLLGALAGAALAENLPAGLALLAVTLVTVASASKSPPPRLIAPFLAILVIAFALLLAPELLRPLAPRGWDDVARALSEVSLAPMGVTATRQAALVAWLHEVGLAALVLAGLGLGVGLFRDDRRAWMSPIVVLVLIDLVYPLAASPKLSVDPLAALRCLALGAFAVAAAHGVAEIIVFLRKSRIPLARAAVALLVVFHMTAAAVTCEESAFVADRSDHFAAEEWTDEALGNLPINAAVLVHSPELTWRLWAAQVIGGQRPDVLVIPVPLLQRGLATSNLLPSEPSVVQVLRDVALTGQASEFGLSLLADARPLHVELDERWDARLVKHLSVEGPWLRFAPQVLGRSDHKLLADHSLALDGRVARGLRVGDAPDESTTAVVIKTLKEHVAALSLIGMDERSEGLLAGLEQLAPEDPFVTGAKLRLAHAARAKRRPKSTELRDLLRF